MMIGRIPWGKGVGYRHTNHLAGKIRSGLVICGLALINLDKGIPNLCAIKNKLSPGTTV